MNYARRGTNCSSRLAADFHSHGATFNVNYSDCRPAPRKRCSSRTGFYAPQRKWQKRLIRIGGNTREHSLQQQWIESGDGKRPGTCCLGRATSGRMVRTSRSCAAMIRFRSSSQPYACSSACYKPTRVPFSSCWRCPLCAGAFSQLSNPTWQAGLVVLKQKHRDLYQDVLGILPLVASQKGQYRSRPSWPTTCSTLSWHAISNPLCVAASRRSPSGRSSLPHKSIARREDASQRVPPQRDFLGLILRCALTKVTGEPFSWGPCAIDKTVLPAFPPPKRPQEPA